MLNSVISSYLIFALFTSITYYDNLIKRIKHDSDLRNGQLDYVLL